MSINYNGVELQHEPLAGIDCPDVQPQGQIDATYLTTLHASKKDFDPAWKEHIKGADVVLHEEFAWSNAAKLLLNSIARGSITGMQVFGQDKDSYAYQRVSAVRGTKVKQEFWDASDKDALTHRLTGLFRQYESGFMESEDLLRQQQLPEALQSMQGAYANLAKYDAVRDAIGVRRVVEAANKSVGQGVDIPKLVIFAGGAHIYQAIRLAQMLGGDTKQVSVESPLDDPFGVSIKPYGNFLISREDRLDTAKAWLSHIMIAHALGRTTHKAATVIANEVNTEIKQMTEDEIMGRLSLSGAR